jgi:hypothetical protein
MHRDDMDLIESNNNHSMAARTFLGQGLGVKQITVMQKGAGLTAPDNNPSALVQYTLTLLTGDANGPETT